MKKSKFEKGITLIAFIIIVGIILTLITVLSSEISNENIFANSENIIDKNDKPQSTINYNSLGEMYKDGKIKVGDYIQYNPAILQNGEVLTFLPDGETAGVLTGHTKGQVITQEQLNWRVLGYDKERNEILLISSTPTNNTITFRGHIGYNNFENVLNETCLSLYSNGEIGATARSLTMEDIEKYLGGNSFNKINFGGGSRSQGGYGFRNLRISSSYSVNSTNGFLIKENSKVMLDLTGNAYFYTASEVIKDKNMLDVLLGANGNYYSWLASKYVRVNSGIAAWGLSVASGFKNGVGMYSTMCLSSGKYAENTFCIRPVVAIPGSITIEDMPLLKTIPTENWNDPLGMYEE